MPNFALGTDQGTLESHPLYDSPFSLEAGGPHKLTYNGFVRVNTGIYDRDGTGDSARNAWHYYLQNLDITVSKYDCSDDPVAGSVATRDADGALHATNFHAGDFSFGVDGIKGIFSGGAFV
jgi:hypothetical protein